MWKIFSNRREPHTLIPESKSQQNTTMPDSPESSNNDQDACTQPTPALPQPAPKSWSPTLKDQTRDALRELQINPLTGKLHLKNCDGRRGYITVEDLVSNQLVVGDNSSGPDSKFESDDDLIAQGWAID
jgi:hypothetical protein